MTDEEFKQLVLSQLQSINEGLWGKKDTDDKGLAGQLNVVCESHYLLKRQFWMLIAFLIGTGVLVGGGIGIADLLGK